MIIPTENNYFFIWCGTWWLKSKIQVASWIDPPIHWYLYPVRGDTTTWSTQFDPNLTKMTWSIKFHIKWKSNIFSAYNKCSKSVQHKLAIHHQMNFQIVLNKFFKYSFNTNKWIHLIGIRNNESSFYSILFF